MRWIATFAVFAAFGCAQVEHVHHKREINRGHGHRGYDLVEKVCVACGAEIIERGECVHWSIHWTKQEAQGK